jgi:hypothetical protein
MSESFLTDWRCSVAATAFIERGNALHADVVSAATVAQSTGPII